MKAQLRPQGFGRPWSSSIQPVNLTWGQPWCFPSQKGAFLEWVLKLCQLHNGKHSVSCRTGRKNLQLFPWGSETDPPFTWDPAHITFRKAWGGGTVPRGEAGAPSWEVREVQWHCCQCGEHSVWQEVRQGARCWPLGLLRGHPGECPMGSAGTYPAKPFSTQAVLTECRIPFGVGHGLHSLRVTNHLGQAKEVICVQLWMWQWGGMLTMPTRSWFLLCPKPCIIVEPSCQENSWAWDSL